MNIFSILPIITLSITQTTFVESSSTDNFLSDDEFLYDVVNSPAITEIYLGNRKVKNPIYIYISPSCLHCGKFIVEDVEEFVKKNRGNCCVVIKLLPTSAKDIFIMKLIQNEAKNENKYFKIYKNYIKRILATIDHIKPTEEQTVMFKGSNMDEEMIKFQVGASDFGFSDEKIIAAIPDMNNSFETSVLKEYKESIKFISDVLKTKELDLPLIVKKSKRYKNLDEAMNA